MTDLSKIPDLALRQKIKPLNDKIEALDAQIERLQQDSHAQYLAASKPLRQQRAALDEELGALLDEREIVGTCSKTSLPIFEGDDYGLVEIMTLEAAQ